VARVGLRLGVFAAGDAADQPQAAAEPLRVCARTPRRTPSAREGRSPLGFDLRTEGPSLIAAAVNQQGSDVPEGEGRDDRDERLLVELARLGPSLHVRVPNYLS
jgi:hypothetical protein